MSDQMSGLLPPTYPIRTTVTDDLVRNRWTVAFRLILAIPAAIVAGIFSIGAALVWVVVWIWTLAAGQTPDWAHRFYSATTRINVHVNSYTYLAANPYPNMTGEPGYPVDVQIDPPAPQRRVITLFRPILVIPMLIVATVLQYVQQIVAIIGWFYSLATGRMNEGMRNLITFCIAFQARTYGYLGFLTDRYPTFSEGQIPTS